MFTNWLTSPSTATSTSVTQTSTASASSFVEQLAPNIMTTPPDIILEVGPPPSVRFVAHSSLLAMHSGYLRSAIRLDENNANIHNTIGGSNSMELPPIYLTNVTPEQFGPLLTYMYTGYLDLTLENIFGVLLATHVLHMPRALEICRAFLARSQAEGFLNGNYLNQINNNNNCEITVTKNSNIIRPIPSKPIISNLGFIVPPMQHVSLPTTDTPFRSLNTQSLENLTKLSNEISNQKITIQKNEESNSSNPSPIDNLNPLETKRKSSPISKITTISISNQNLVPTANNQTTISRRSPKLKRSRSKSSSTTDHTMTSGNTVKFSITGQNIATTSNIQNNSNNINSSSQENENKVIIDVASCDGPVRFRRVLNDAYGRQPESVHIPPPQHERSHESVSYSFHQQMAKNISQHRHQQQQQHQQQQSEESENSEDVKNNANNTNQHCSNGSNTSANSNGETFNCVYCKHTFKSQYCYQKHAKRHLNPLALEQGEGIILAPSATSFRDLFKDNKSIVSSGNGGNVTTATIMNNNKRETATTTISSKLTANNFNNDIKVSEPSSNNTSSLSSSSNKREVRPLDMNVQYYPCKTCGSKFPSYYFVHKHRKMCHANEDN